MASKSAGKTSGFSGVTTIEAQCPECGFFQEVEMTRAEKRNWESETVWQECDNDDCQDIAKFRIC